MTVREKQVDELGQLIFRIETNFWLFEHHTVPKSNERSERFAKECNDDILKDIGKLKELKLEMMKE